jgi:hypothetical protein
MILTTAQVLIVDVMSVPDQGISDTVQGAFLIAIVLPGIVLGGLVPWLIKWLAKCMGCIVGGFCMAMWLETLCPGGLIKPSKMTAVLICVMCAVSLAPSIPKFKKWVELAYMIFSAFSGSTALVLGIDCYSRAGLKEFWVYTWRMLDFDCDLFLLTCHRSSQSRALRLRNHNLPYNERHQSRDRHHPCCVFLCGGSSIQVLETPPS